ncbi:MAG: hypothetical protein HYV32_00640 [Candidatus Kerfeldbacteria bacterium]|nr:hypothetical protein [Candidatus Kerfeldbacteria bacterium]
MGIENGGNKRKLKIELSAPTKKAIEGEFSGGRKLTGDSFNAWPFGIMCDEVDDAWPWPAQYYEEYLRKQSRNAAEASYKSTGEEKFLQEADVYVDYVIQRSDPAAVVAFDHLVDEFNADLSRIREENDMIALREFHRRVKELIYKKM